MKLLAFVFSLLCFGISGVAAKEIMVGMGNFAPYFIEKGNTGIFGDLITAVFRHMPDHQPRFLFGLPTKRLWLEFKMGRIDAAPLPDSLESAGCRTDQIFQFFNVAIVKVNAKLEINNISDLAGKRIVAFQGAKKVFGTEFTKLTEFGYYTELANQNTQAKMLIIDRVDVSIGDMFIFLQTLKDIKNQSVTPKDFAFYHIFPPAYRRMGFRDIEMCAPFNKALKQVHQSGEYERIYDSYLKRLSD